MTLTLIPRSPLPRRGPIITAMSLGISFRTPPVNVKVCGCSGLPVRWHSCLYPHTLSHNFQSFPAWLLCFTNGKATQQLAHCISKEIKTKRCLDMISFQMFIAWDWVYTWAEDQCINGDCFWLIGFHWPHPLCHMLLDPKCGLICPKKFSWGACPLPRNVLP